MHEKQGRCAHYIVQDGGINKIKSEEDSGLCEMCLINSFQKLKSIFSSTYLIPLGEICTV